MNRYLRNLNRIEFIITLACTGKCKHCSEGDHKRTGENINKDIAAEAVKYIAEKYNIRSVMTFGGEPLLYPETVCTIHSIAREMRIPQRQLITNGFFSKDPCRIQSVAEQIAECGVNDVLLSVDAFHQETTPLDVVKRLAAEAKGCGIPIRLQPAWLRSATDDNPYNSKTREILNSFAEMAISVNEGNVIFPEGNARKYLAEYFSDELPENPYVEDPRDVRCVSFSPNGDVLGGNVYKKDIMEIIKDYAP